jgi:hypothetical protein
MLTGDRLRIVTDSNSCSKFHRDTDAERVDADLRVRTETFEMGIRISTHRVLVIHGLQIYAETRLRAPALRLE